MSMSDEELVRDCVRGRAEAWEVFARDYSTLIRQTVLATLRRFGVRDNQEELAKDLFQEFFVALKRDGCRRLGRFEGRNRCTLSSWLKVVAARFVIDHLRRQKPSPLSVDDANAAGGHLREASLADGSSRPDKKAEDNAALLALRRELERLPTRDQLIMKLVCEDGLSVQEVARGIRMREGTVYTRISRIRQRLRTKIVE